MPDALLQWMDGLDHALSRRLRNLSHAVNVQMLRCCGPANWSSTVIDCGVVADVYTRIAEICSQWCVSNGTGNAVVLIVRPFPIGRAQPIRILIR